MTVSETLNEVVEEMRNKYCKFPETWDEDKEGVDLSDSDIFKNCPLNKL